MAKVSKRQSLKDYNGERAIDERKNHRMQKQRIAPQLFKRNWKDFRR
jgi:hypothetical protein